MDATHAEQELDNTLSREFDHRSLSESMVDAIARLIIRGDFHPGTRLTESGVAERLQTSRGPVREAFQALATQGLIVVFPRRGAAVAELNATDARDLYETRSLLEPIASRLAVEALDPSTLEELDALIALMDNAIQRGDKAAYLDHNSDYHLLLISHCPNAALRQLIELTWNKSLRYWFFHVHLDNDYMRRSLDLHLRLHQAISARDAAQTESLTIDLLASALRNLLDHFPADTASPPEQSPAISA